MPQIKYNAVDAGSLQSNTSGADRNTLLGMQKLATKDFSWQIEIHCFDEACDQILLLADENTLLADAAHQMKYVCGDLNGLLFET